MGLQNRDWFNDRKQQPNKPTKRPTKRKGIERSETFWTGVVMAAMAAVFALYMLL